MSSLEEPSPVAPTAAPMAGSATNHNIPQSPRPASDTLVGSPCSTSKTIDLDHAHRGDKVPPIKDVSSTLEPASPVPTTPSTNISPTLDASHSIASPAGARDESEVALACLLEKVALEDQTIADNGVVEVADKTSTGTEGSNSEASFPEDHAKLLDVFGFKLPAEPPRYPTPYQPLWEAPSEPHHHWESNPAALKIVGAYLTGTGPLETSSILTFEDLQHSLPERDWPVAIQIWLHSFVYALEYVFTAVRYLNNDLNVLEDRVRKAQYFLDLSTIVHKSSEPPHPRRGLPSRQTFIADIERYGKLIDNLKLKREALGNVAMTRYRDGMKYARALLSAFSSTSPGAEREKELVEAMKHELWLLKERYHPTKFLAATFVSLGEPEKASVPCTRWPTW